MPLKNEPEPVLDSFTRIPERTCEAFENIKRIFIHPEREKSKISMYVLVITGEWIGFSSYYNCYHSEFFKLEISATDNPAGYEIPLAQAKKRNCVLDFANLVYQEYIFQQVRTDHLSRLHAEWERYVQTTSL